ncbi:MAG: glycosyltransferase [Pseudonocardiaceae bacterium]
MTSGAALARAATGARATSEESWVTQHSALLSVSAGVVGVLSYTCSLAMAHLLTARDYSTYAGGQMLLGIVGIVASALVPLPLAHIVRGCAPGSEGRRRGMAFAVLVSLISGVIAAGIGACVTALFAPPPVVAAVAASALALFAISPAMGWLQGGLRFVRYAMISVAEVGVRLLFSVGAVLLGWGAAGAMTGFVAGTGAILACGLGRISGDLGWRPHVLAERLRWSETGDVALTQLVVSTLVGTDVVLVALIGDGSPTAAGYQALATLAKGPVYVAAGTVLITFPLLRTTSARADTILRAALRSFLSLALPAAAVIATMPTELAMLVLPKQYAASLGMLPWLASAGVGYATLTVLATVLLAMRAYRRSQLGLLLASIIVPSGLVLGWRLNQIQGLAVGAAVGALLAATVLAVITTPLLPSGVGRLTITGLLGAAPLFVALQLTRPHPALWLTAVALAGAVVLRGMQHGEPSDGDVAGAPDTREASPPDQLRILHLGFEDPAMPGAGGGSVRTHEINRRLAAEHTVTVLVQRFPGYVDRTQDGVQYVHVGIGSGRNRLTRLLGYVACLPHSARRRAADLVVEDFFAPISSMAAPLWTAQPTIGVVQWLNAAEKSGQYKLPFHLVERFGVRNHHRLIAVSDGVAGRLRAMNPRVTIDVIGNGVPPEAFDVVPRLGENIAFVGRLETTQKGLDVLLKAWAVACLSTPGLLIIAGTGPDERRLRTLVADLGIGKRVRFVGWVAGAAKFELLASARVVAVPSRFETFGIVALEALATGTPVVAFDISCLRDVVPAGCGLRVAPFNVAAYADALIDTYSNTQWIAAAAPRARAFAAGYNWDVITEQQREIYTTAASTGVWSRIDRARR